MQLLINIYPMRANKIPCLLLSLIFFSASAQDTTFSPWRRGCLDIHHINTGRGNATFMVFPDGTTLLVDAGDIDKAAFDRKYAPLKAAQPLPNDTMSPAAVIAAYIRNVMAAPISIDYALITHFHGDHFGQLTALGDRIPIHVLIDRGYPAYDYPTDLRRYYNSPSSPFPGYLRFVGQQVAAGRMTAVTLHPGQTDQIVLKHDPAAWPIFYVRNLKANDRVWTGNDTMTRSLFSVKEIVDDKGNFNENPLSLAIRISYGLFDYYTGGDNTGREGDDLPGGRDTETPMAAAIKGVDAMSLDHHGNRDANNFHFLHTLHPRVVVAQTWCSDQPGQETSHHLATGAPSWSPPDVFYLNVQDQTRTYLGPWITRSAKSLDGHVMIRVMPGGNEYYVYILEDRSTTLRVRERFGPYRSE